MAIGFHRFFKRNTAILLITVILFTGLAVPASSAEEEQLSSGQAGIASVQTAEWVNLKMIGSDRYAFSEQLRISPDGRYVGMEDSEGSDFITILDRHTDEIAYVYTPVEGEMIRDFTMSDNAQYIAFSAEGNDGVTIYLHDRSTNETETISVRTSTWDRTPVISGDGRYVAFQTGEELLEEDLNPGQDIYVYDRVEKTFELISKYSEALEYAESNENPSISYNGQYVAFESHSDSFVEDDTNWTTDIFVYDRVNDIMRRVNKPTGGEEPNLSSTKALISADGKTVVFQSNAKNIAPVNPKQFNNVFAADIESGEVKLLSDVAEGEEGYLYYSGMSPDGRYAAYFIDNQLFVTDIENGTSVQPVFPENPSLNLISYVMPALSNQANSIVFVSEYDENEYANIFVADRSTDFWSEGSTLEATEIATSEIRLQWSGAEGAPNLSGYQLFGYRGGDLILDTLIESTIKEYLVTGLLPNTEYDFKIEAVDSSGFVSTDGPAVSAATLKDDSNAYVAWEFSPRGPGQMPNIESSLLIKGTGPSGWRAAAEIVYQTWFDDEGELLPQPKVVTTNVAFTESVTEPGLYEGSFFINKGISQLISMTFQMENGTGNTLTATGFDEPYTVNGGIELTVANPGALDVNDLRILARGKGGGISYATVDGSGPHAINGLRPNDVYEITVMDKTGLQLRTIGNVSIQPGLYTPVSITLPVPASLGVLVTDHEGNPVPNIQVFVYDEAGHNLQTRMNTLSDGRDQWSRRLESGTSFVLTADVDDSQYYTPSEKAITLKPGLNEVQINLEPLPIGQLTGIVTDPDGQPVINALITATHEHPVTGKLTNVSVRSGLDGDYELTLFAGEVRIQASETAHALTSEPVTAQIIDRETVTLNLPLIQPTGGLIELKVYEKRIGEQWEGPLDFTRAQPYSISLNQSTFSGNNHFHNYKSYTDRNILEFSGFPGQRVTVCVVPSLVSIAQSCQSFEMDYSSNKTLEFYMQETGSWVRGVVPDNGNLDSFSASLYRYDSVKGEYINTSHRYFYGNLFEMHVPNAGDYRLQFSRLNPETWAYDGARIQFAIGDQEIKSIGEVELVHEKPLVDPSFSFFAADSARAVPGGMVYLRAEYRNSNEQAIENASITIPLPEGLEPVRNGEGSIIVNGQTGTPSYDNRNLVIQLGTIARSETSSALSVPIRIDPNYSQPNARLTATLSGTLEGETREDTLGSVILQLPEVTLDVPNHIYQPEGKAAVSGSAPPGSTVAIYDTGAWVGSAKASAAGLWKATVTLNDLGDPSIHALQAIAEVNGVRMESSQAFIDYDTAGPRLLEAAMSQLPDGRWMAFEPEMSGTATFPYTVVPGNPFAFQFRFDNPSQVENVRVYMEGQQGTSVLAKLEGGLYRAVVPVTKGTLGSVYVSYDRVQERFDEQNHERTIEEVRTSLPPAMRDFEVETVTPFQLVDGIYEGTAVIRLPQLDNARMTISLRVDPNSDYEPTEDELSAADRTGLPLFDAGYESEETEQSMTSTVSGVLPIDFILPQDNGRVSTSALSTKASGWGALAEFTMEVHTEVTEPLGNINDVKESMNGWMEYSQKINKIMYNASSPYCVEGAIRNGTQAAKALLATVGGEVAKTAIGAWVGAMALEGAPGIVAGIIGDAVSNQIDNYVDEQINAVGTGYNPCMEEEKKPYRQELPEFEWKRTKIAEPKWIYDPSGYVYEGVESNRLEGVKSTVMYLDTALNRWMLWDAEPYWQTNPLETDGEGRYGWDVPPGKWKVVWEKEGYVTAESPELDVPPPHTEVHAGMISYDPPAADSLIAAASESDSYVEIKFNKYLKTDIELEEAVTLTDTEGVPIAGTAQFMNAEESPSGERLSNTIRFLPAVPLTAGQKYEIQIPSSYIISYAGVPMEQNLKQEVSAVQKDETGPKPVSAVFEDSTFIRVLFDEPLSADAIQPNKFEWMGRTDLVTSAVPYSLPGEEVREVLLTIVESAAARQQAGHSLTVLSGAVRDATGNSSTESVLSVAIPDDALSTESRLSNLSVSGGSLAPAFSPDTTEYTVTVNRTAEEIALTGTLMDAKSTINIDGLPASNGISEQVRIPDDGIIMIKVQGEDPTAINWYTITINRSDDEPPPTTGGGGGNYNPTAPANGDDQDIGTDAVVEKSTENGQTIIDVNLSLTTIEKLIASGSAHDVYTAEFTDTADEYTIRIPAQGLLLLSGKKAELHLRAGDHKVKLNTHAFEMPEDASSMVISIVTDSSEESEALLNKLTDMNRRFTPQSSIAEVGFYAEYEDEQLEEIAPSETGAVLLEWQTSGALIYRFDSETGRWLYVPSKLTSGVQQFPWHADHLFAAWSYFGSFADIRGHWAQEEIDWMASRLYVTGYDANQFRPDNKVTRAEFAAMLVRIFGLQGTHAVSDSQFKDVPADSWYADAVNAASEAGLIQGVGDELFKPNETVTREQMTVMVWRAYEQLIRGEEEADSIDAERILAAFQDEDRISEWARIAVAAAWEEGFVQGVAPDQFDPEGSATRAQAAVILQRIALYLEP